MYMDKSKAFYEKLFNESVVFYNNIISNYFMCEQSSSSHIIDIQSFIL